MKKITELQAAGKMTDMEGKVMTYLLTEGIYDKYYSDVYAEEIAAATKIPMQQLKGVLSSLTKKQLIAAYAFNEGERPLIYVSERGYKLDDEYEEKWEEESEEDCQWYGGKYLPE
ncbi:hypothetical protein [Bacillus phage phiAGATE]|uniref:Uncharacterized protein n=1 Tax=Bacillus phage phiAGATE TaxID=1204533 RepID=L0LC47_9CAUD|nr:hypothetical protein G380_gp172 [Bacillus phage phiAGATE]YP_008855200.1 hypothetical protein G380_gp001 [Bacillus phage phiAGATE]AGB62651.1 hypothetical protein [Bacillus phage phiAGATE]AHB12548.1 hypothetical protein [Bacillus phage phiAGATE]